MVKKNAYNDTSKQLTWFKCLIAPQSLVIYPWMVLQQNILKVRKY